MASSNRMEITQFGHQLLQELPEELGYLSSLQSTQQNFFSFKPKGTKIDFAKFASETYKIRHLHIHKTEGVLRKVKDPEATTKLQMHHDDWIDKQERTALQIKKYSKQHSKKLFSLYEPQKSELHQKGGEILSELKQLTNQTKKRTKDLVKRLFLKKYKPTLPLRSANPSHITRLHKENN